MPVPLPRNDRHDVLIVIPTLGDPEVLVPCVRRVLQNTDGRRVRVALAVNPIDAEAAHEATETIAAIQARAKADPVLLITYPGPVGFGKSINGALSQIAFGGEGIPAAVVVLNDDARPTAGWLDGLLRALDPEAVGLSGEPPDERGARPAHPYDSAVFGPIGMSGPVSNLVAGSQQVQLPPGANPEAFAAKLRRDHAGQVVAASFLSGFCLCLRREALEEVALPQEPGKDAVRLFDDEAFPVGGYEDNDLCVRLELLGWRRVVALDAYVHHLGHQTLDRHFPGQKRGLANRRAYYEKWAGHPRVTGTGKVSISYGLNTFLRGEKLLTSPQLVALWRVKVETGNDLLMLRDSIQRLVAPGLTGRPIADGIALLLTDDPIRPGRPDARAPDWDAAVGAMTPADKAMVQAIATAHAAPDVEAAIRRWVQALAQHAVPVMVDFHTSDEREERNRVIRLAESMGPDWLLSVDHDEILEDRITRAEVERLMRHPDPLVSHWDLGWLNHWDNARLVRQDPPWADGAYRTGMRGFRLWRASPCAGRPNRILAGNALGLHCGNCPDTDLAAKRVSGLRFRHLGYVRGADRARKHRRYVQIDPTPSAALTGGGYGHLIHEEGMRLSPFVPVDGIGLAMLVHAGEDPENVARHLDVMHGIADRIVLVWTSDEPPSDDVIAYAGMFGAELVHHPLDEDFAKARNAGLDALAATPPGRAQLGWALALDPDEVLQDSFADPVALRRMAECSDAHGWLFRFANLRPRGSGEDATMSECVRMVRMIPGIRYAGRVHEGFDKAFTALSERGEQVVLRPAPFLVINPGLSGSDDDMETKLRFYQRLTLRELHEDPRNATAWVSLGMQLVNDGDQDGALECFKRSISADERGFLAWRELALWYLRAGTEMLAEARERTGMGHPWRAIADAQVEWLQKNVPPQPLIGAARRGEQRAPIELPPGPTAEEEPGEEFEDRSTIKDRTWDLGAPSGYEPEDGPADPE